MATTTNEIEAILPSTDTKEMKAQLGSLQTSRSRLWANRVKYFNQVAAIDSTIQKIDRMVDILQRRIFYAENPSVTKLKPSGPKANSQLHALVRLLKDMPKETQDRVLSALREMQP